MDELTIKVDGKEYKVQVDETEEGKVLVYCGNDVYTLDPQADDQLPKLDFGKRSIELKDGEAAIEAPLPGIIAELKVKKGDKVKKDQSVLKLIAMKMENDVVSPKDGEIKEINAKKDDNVNKGDLLIVVG